MNPAEIIKDISSNYSRYNGGWIKSVQNKIDKTFTNGYSIIGEFYSAKKEWVTPGLYLDCSIDGSRKHPVKYYTLFIIKPDGTGEIIHEEKDTVDWATNLWDVIEHYYSKYNNKESLRIERQQLLNRLHEIEELLKVME